MGELFIVAMALLGFLLFPALHYWSYRRELKQSLEALPGVQWEQQQRWFHFPKFGTLWGALRGKPPALEGLLPASHPTEESSLSVQEQATEASSEAGTSTLQVTVQKRRLDARNMGPFLFSLFPREQGHVARTVGQGLSRPFLWGFQGLLYLSCLGFATILASIWGMSTGSELSLSDGFFGYCMGLFFCSLVLAANFVGRRLRGEFPMRVASEEAKTGDRDFDERYCAKGDEDLILASLQYPLRSALMSVGHTLLPLVERSQVSFFMPRMSRGSRESYQRYLSWSVEVLHHLSRAEGLEPSEVPARLLENVKADPVVGVRQRSLRWLHAKYSHTSEALEALEYALGGDIEELKAMARLLQRGESLEGGQLTMAALPEAEGQLSMPREEGQISLLQDETRDEE